jgi:hypothetical protein
MSRYFPEVFTLLEGESVTSYVNFNSVMPSSETLSASTAQGITGSSTLTVGATSIPSASVVINGSTLVASRYIKFRVSGQSASGGYDSKGSYEVLCEGVTTGSDTRRGIARFVTSRAS